MPEVTCGCGAAFDPSVDSEHAWVCVRDQDYDRLIELEIRDRRGDDAGDEAQQLFGFLHECPKCGRVQWKKPDREAFLPYGLDVGTGGLLPNNMTPSVPKAARQLGQLMMVAGVLGILWTGLMIVAGLAAGNLVTVIVAGVTGTILNGLLVSGSVRFRRISGWTSKDLASLTQGLDSLRGYFKAQVVVEAIVLLFFCLVIVAARR